MSGLPLGAFREKERFENCVSGLPLGELCEQLSALRVVWAVIIAMVVIVMVRIQLLHTSSTAICMLPSVVR